MTSIKSSCPLLPGKYYHLYNRGINGSKIFLQSENYHYFLSLFRKYMSDCEVLAYCLISNHFHFLIYIPEYIEPTENNILSKKINTENEIDNYISNQLRRLFISYSQAINKRYERTGSLFERPYKRIMLTDDEQLKYLIFYIHNNPSKHLNIDYTKYRYSSFAAYKSDKPSSIKKAHGMALFGGIREMLNYHRYNHSEREALLLEKESD